jgi:hypothetical protein
MMELHQRMDPNTWGLNFRVRILGFEIYGFRFRV